MAERTDVGPVYTVVQGTRTERPRFGLDLDKAVAWEKAYGVSLKLLGHVAPAEAADAGRRTGMVGRITVAHIDEGQDLPFVGHWHVSVDGAVTSLLG